MEDGSGRLLLVQTLNHTSEFSTRRLNRRQRVPMARTSDIGYLSSPASAIKVRPQHTGQGSISLTSLSLLTAIHDPHGKLNAKEFAKLDYPAPIVIHSEARARALARYKNPGEGDAE